jgi:thioredoxin reductase (NADPH)
MVWYDLRMVDVAIIGLGAAGYTAAIYAARYKLSTAIIGLEDGGMGLTATEVGNWPGEIEIAGPELMEKFKKHALSFGEIVTQKIARVEKVAQAGKGFSVTLDDGSHIEARTIIFATGSQKRHLNVPGEDRLSGKGVTYCATCDAFFYRGKDVAVVGGGDAAVEGAAIAAQVAKRVYLIHRRSAFRAEPYWVDRVNARPNVTTILERNVVEILGEAKVSSVKLDRPWENKDTIAVDGVFIEIGADPATALPLQLGCALDERGFLKVDEAMRTNVPGIFGAGDLTSGSNHFAQFTTAAGEATVAANSVFNYLQENE